MRFTIDSSVDGTDRIILLDYYLIIYLIDYDAGKELDVKIWWW